MGLFDSISQALGTDGGGGGLLGGVSDILGTSGKKGVGLLQDPFSEAAGLAALAYFSGGTSLGAEAGAGATGAGAGTTAGAAGTAGAATDAAWAGGGAATAGGGVAGAGADFGAGTYGAGAGATGAAGAGDAAAFSALGSGGTTPALMESMMGSTGYGASSAGAGGAAGLSPWTSAMDSLGSGWGTAKDIWNTAKPWLKGGASGMQTIMGFQNMMAGQQRQQQQQQYSQQLQQLMANPGSITSMPGYESGMEAVRRSMAAQGYQGSGNMMGALQNQGGAFYQQQLSNLAQLQGSGGGAPSFAGGATQFGAGLAGLASM